MKLDSRLFLLSLLFCFPSLRASSTINHLQVQFDNDKSQCTIVFSSPVKSKRLYLSSPPRFVLDLPNVRLKNPRQLASINDPIIKSIRYGYPKNKTLRIVFDFNAQVRTKILGHSTSLTLDFQPQNNYALLPQPNWSLTSKKTKMKIQPVHYAKSPNNTYRLSALTPQPVMVENSNKPAKGMVVIVIDPGHGGKDPGAVGPQGIPEKNVVLAIARALQREIERQPGFTAKLTRNGDYYLTLRERLALARKYRGDMFIAIHADAHPRNDPNGRYAHGASVYALSLRGATSEAARWLAKRENESELMGGVELSDKSNLLKSVLLNLSQTATIQASLRIGDEIIGSLRNVGGLHRNRVEQAAFVVLKSPDIPSLLVETGYITNEREELNLANAMYQQRLASAITQGIRSYFRQWPPRDSLLAELKTRHR